MMLYNNIENLTQDNKKVFEVIFRFGPLTKKNIIKHTNMKLTTLNRSMDILIEHKLVVEEGEQESTGGRKPALFNVTSREYFLLGIDISRTYSKVIITSLRKEILYEEEFEMEHNMTPDTTVDKINELFQNSLVKLGFSKDRIIGGGLGTIGPLDSKNGIIFKPNNFYAKGWNNVPIKDMLEKKLKLQIIVNNGANTAVYAEYLSRTVVEYNNIVYVNCGIGIRMGVMANGNIIPTINNSNDAFGHMVINYDGEQCYCGKFGCVECYGSILAIEKRYKSYIKLGRDSLITKNTKDITYIDIINVAEDGEILANQVLEFSARLLAIGLKNYITLVDTQKIVLSGPIINTSNIFYNYLLKSIQEDMQDHNIVLVKGGNYKDNAIALGAAQMFVKEKLLK